jgi:hypothetical protein
MESCVDEKLQKEPASRTQTDDFQTKSAAGRKRKRSNLEAETCAICLEVITERAVAVPCNHLSFDFICIAQWLQENKSCPLCKADVKQVQYGWRGPRDYRTYQVPEPSIKELCGRADRGRNRQPARPRGGRDIGWGPSASSAQPSEDHTLPGRRQVYRDRTFSLHVGTSRTSQYRDFTPADFTATFELQSRARTFLRRELRVFNHLGSGRATGPRAKRDFLVEYIVAILKTNEPKAADAHAEDLIADFLGREDANLLLHELGAWLRSPYTTLEAWDQHVQYQSQHGGRDKGESLHD